VHRVLETVDFADPDLPGAVGDALAGARARWPVPVGDPATVTAGLVAALTTPLASLTDDTPLAGIAAADRLDELGFELPVAGGDRPDGGVDLAAVADLLADRLGPDDPLAAYPPRLREPSVAGVVRGYLTGSLDLVIRRTGPDGAARFAVVDYKTNVLADRADLSAWDYRPAALAEAMIRAHYPLQALFYSVALHRYLRWRIPAYDPRRHLGGVGYLFLRGMCGPDTPRVGGQRCGVFAWHPDPGLVTDLSDLIDRGGTGRVGP
jgi:exodeoxyribonuclease V beta subunit